MYEMAVGGWEIWRLVNRKDMTLRASNTTGFTGWCLNRVAWERKFLTAWDHPEAYGMGVIIKKAGGQGNTQVRGRLERGLMHLGDVTQEHSAESLSQRVPTGHSSLESYNHKALSYQWPADVGWVLQICKVDRLWMANNLLVWVIWKITEGIPWQSSG